MACSPDFVQYIIDHCSGAGEIAVKKMMGDYCVYCDGVLFGLICDNNFYVKVTEPGRAVLKEVISRSPYDGAKDYYFIGDVDDRDYLTALIKATIPAQLRASLAMHFGMCIAQDAQSTMSCIAIGAIRTSFRNWTSLWRRMTG